mmetsp:Transcript_26458/g.63164  ORF Transcript_26458/g.63164 Transcript_26458/m.63164 type:complete len:295 (+) Transcript_26458:477-1361(+)
MVELADGRAPVGVGPRHEGLGPLKERHEGHRHHRRADLEDGEGVGPVELGDPAVELLPGHHALAKHTTEGEAHVGDHRRHELHHVEGELRRGRVGHAAHHRDEGRVHHGVRPLAGHEAGEHGGEGRLEGLEDVGEAEGAGAERHVAADVAGRVQRHLGGELLDLGGGEDGRLLDLECPLHRHPRDANSDAREGLEPRHVEGVERLLVGDVVEDVEEIPEAEVGSGLEGPRHLARHHEGAEVDGGLLLRRLEEELDELRGALLRGRRRRVERERRANSHEGESPHQEERATAHHR